MQQSTTSSTSAQAFEQIVTDLERRAAECAEAHSNKLRRMTEAHRRERFIDWYNCGEDEPLNQLLAAHYEMIGEREPDEMTEDEYRDIIGIHYDRLTDEERAEIERQIRQEDPEFYFDDHYYSDDMIEARRLWDSDMSELTCRAHELLRECYVPEFYRTLDDPNEAHKLCEWARMEISRIASEYSPHTFCCDACGQMAHSHDETGALIAGVGVWAMPNGDTGSYMVCEACIDKPETHDALERLFDESAAYHAAHDEAFALSVPKLIEKPFEEWTEEDRREIERQVDAYVKTRIVVLVREYRDARNDAQQAADGNGSTSGTVGQNSGNSGAQGGPQPRPSGAAAKPKFQFEFLTIDQLMNRPSKTWLVDRLLGEREMVVPIGPSGSGKTFVTIDLIYAMCLGQQWAGYFDIPRPLTVAYCAGEGLDGLKDRFAAAEAKWGARLPLDRFVMVPNLPQLFRDGAQHIKEFVEQWRLSGRGALDVLVLDTFHKATTGADENSSKDIGIVYDAIQYAINELGCSTWTPHHTNKGGKDSRGSTAIMADFDSMIRIEKNSGDHVMTAIKIKDAGEWPDLHFKLIAHGDSTYVDWSGSAASSGPHPSKAQTVRDAVYSLLFKYPTTRFAASGIANGIGATTNEVTKALGDLYAAGKVDRYQVTGKRHSWEWSLADALAAAQGLTGQP